MSTRSRVPGHPTASVLAATLLLISAVAACAAGSATSAEPRAPDPDPAQLPRAAGPLDLRVSYPRAGQLVATRDENFIFGSTGNGDARLRIDGAEVDVRDNGAFLAFLPVPADGVYRLRATLAGEEQTLEVPVELPPPPPMGDAVVVPGSVYPAGAWVALPGERIEAGFTGTAGGTAALIFADGTRVPLVEGRAASGGVTDFEIVEAGPGGAGAAADPDSDPERRLVPYRGSFHARRVVAADTTVPWPTLATEDRPAEAAAARVELVVGDEVRTRPLPLNLVVADPGWVRVGDADDPRPPEQNGDDRINARPGPGGGPYHYDWIDGTELELIGERQGAYRVRLTDDLSAWTPGWGVTLRAPGTAPPASRVTTVRLDPRSDHVDVHVAMDRRLPYRVDEGERSVRLEVYGALSRVNFLQHGGLDPYVERAEWSQPSDRLFVLDLHLAGAPWGYEVVRGEGADLVLRLNRPPATTPLRDHPPGGAPPVPGPDDPLAGLTVGVDPGHGGDDRETMGPTGLTEADANLGIALALRDQLEARGVRVVLTRTTDTTVSLVERTALARAEDVDVWISVHNNAFPDGVDPWENNGTSVYYNHPHAAGLARAVQRELVAELGLRDLGVGRADLHPARFTWAPAILSENVFMMIPEQEELLKSEEGRRRIARAHVRGLEAWLRER